MSNGRKFDAYNVTTDTDITAEAGSLTFAEVQWLTQAGVLRIKSHQTATGEVTNAILNVEKLADIAFENDILSKVASSVETDILGAFKQSEETTLTTGEIAGEIDRPKSSVSRALTKLTEKGKLNKVQSGVYRVR
ncbi:helix-turn-helix domain-containing protein [Haladaptatus sp. GCM10025707]|uniref:helix-turn-helix domain-containing protein n=1 Tax=unclassified Haladaptatus TaxID=2622732 RepID=UPI0023E8F053|nr:helix-turn-helix domain-containing protein [Haladaptatus sp. QDMS2]